PSLTSATRSRSSARSDEPAKRKSGWPNSAASRPTSDPAAPPLRSGLPSQPLTNVQLGSMQFAGAVLQGAHPPQRRRKAETFVEIYVPNSAHLLNSENMLRRLDFSNPDELVVSFHEKWVSVHPVVLAMIGAIALEARS